MRNNQQNSFRDITRIYYANRVNKVQFGVSQSVKMET